jgi:DNA-directed RNA polymerase specialized sigma24 family protein
MERTPPDPESVLAQTAHVRRLARDLVFDAHGARDLAQEALLLALDGQGDSGRPPAAGRRRRQD